MLADDRAFLERVLEKIDRISVEKVRDIISSIEKENSLLKEVLDSLDYGIVVVDNDNEIILTNSLGRMFVRDSGGKVVENIRFKNIACVLKNALSSGGSKDVPLKDGRIIRINRKIMASGLTVFTFKDITADYQKSISEKQKESISALSTLVAGIAHEIKNPLSSIFIHFDVLEKLIERDADRVRISKTMDTIRKELNRLNRILNDFLFAVKPFKKREEYVDVNGVVKEVVELVKPEAEKLSVKVELYLDGTLPKIIADRELVKQAVLNVVKNAVEAMEETGGKLMVSTYFDRGSVAVKISDTGKGIPVEEIPRIFEPYYTTKAMGTGLGLTNVYRIVKEHSGSIEVDSQVGEGTTFILHFPLYPHKARSLPADDDSDG